MPTYQRYAIFYTPPPGDLADFGAHWLGWDLRSGTHVEQYDIPSLALATQVAQKYGFHATLKAPFNLVESASAADLLNAASVLASRQSAFEISLQLAPLGRILALRPTTKSTPLNALADACVTTFDRFRGPLLSKDIARRNPRRLSKRQREYLTDWGYPHVFQEFQFHMTLTRPVDGITATNLRTAAQKHLPQSALNISIDRITLVGEREDRHFDTISDFKLASSYGASLS